ncbi:hypothetical protein WN51_05877, partial [Melipona quadrifasciata]
NATGSSRNEKHLNYVFYTDPLANLPLAVVLRIVLTLEYIPDYGKFAQRRPSQTIAT